VIRARNVLEHYLHLRGDGELASLPVSDRFWEELGSGAYPQLDEGRLLSAFSFAEPWSTWERHPAGEELVMLLSGAATLLLEEDGRVRKVDLDETGDFILVPRNVWHTARTRVPTTMLFLTPGAGTEHRGVDA